MKGGAMAPATTDIDIYCDEVLTDPYPTYVALRQQAPAIFMTAHNSYMLTRYDECRAALKNWAVFSSAQGVMMNDPLNQIMAGRILLCTDGTRHGQLRATVAAPLTMRALADVRAEIDNEAVQLVERLVAAETFDVVRDLAEFLPVRIVSTLVGIPEEGRDRMVEWGSAVFNSIGPLNDKSNEGFRLRDEMNEFLTTRCTRETLTPGGWAIALYEAADRGDINPDDPARLMNDYMGPALDTTINATASMMWLFAKHPDQWDLLRQRPDLASNAIDEVLRLETVIQGFARHTTADYQVGDTTIPAGSRVLISYGSANRDDRTFAGPDRFDIERTNASDHLGLGYGSHSCPGGHLARMEMRALLHALIPRVERFELGPIERKLNNVIRGLATCIVTTVPSGYQRTA
jgi:cytochrome P450